MVWWNKTAKPNSTISKPKVLSNFYANLVLFLKKFAKNIKLKSKFKYLKLNYNNKSNSKYC